RDFGRRGPGATAVPGADDAVVEVTGHRGAGVDDLVEEIVEAAGAVVDHDDVADRKRGPHLGGVHDDLGRGPGAAVVARDREVRGRLEVRPVVTGGADLLVPV